MDRFVFLSRSPSDTFSLGQRVGGKLEEGSIISLIGELGCGKTLFTRGLCVGLGVPEREVSSPTFAFVNEYSGKLPVFHIDLYRLNTMVEEFEIGMLDYLRRAESGILVIEWAEKVISLLPESYLRVEFQVLSARKRQLALAAFGRKFSDLLEELNQ